MSALPEVIVITPSIGKSYLKKAVESVSNQDYENLSQLIVVDGEAYREEVLAVLKDTKAPNYKILTLPFNTGGNNFYGHRIYAACSYLVNADFVFYLDEDNWFDIDHVSSLIDLIKRQNLDWAYSLRKIYSHDDNYITDDNCESLGKWPAYSGMPNLVDTSCYAIKREIVTSIGHAWYGKFAADRDFYRNISSLSSNFNTTSRHTSNYRLHENRMPNSAFFYSGNSFMLSKYKQDLPWLDNPGFQKT